jgi:hypothetical protein
MVMSPPRLWPLTDCTANYRPFLSSESPRVEAGNNTSTVIPASRKRRQKGNPTSSSHIYIYIYIFSQLAYSKVILISNKGLKNGTAAVKLLTWC